MSATLSISSRWPRAGSTAHSLLFGAAMRFTPRAILLIVAAVLFVLAAVGVPLGGLDLTNLGLAAFAAAFVVTR